MRLKVYSFKQIFLRPFPIDKMYQTSQIYFEIANFFSNIVEKLWDLLWKMQTNGNFHYIFIGFFHI
jgi:hypothetical protein